MGSQLHLLKQQVTDYGELYPGLLFAGIVLLPAFGFPASALLLLAGIVWGSNPASCAIALGAIFLNIIVTHSFAAGPGKRVISRFLGERLKPWERFSAADHAKVTWLVRLTPGIPLFVQNYLLGFLGIGSLDVSSAGSEGVEVQFRYVRKPHRLKELIRQLQARLED